MDPVGWALAATAGVLLAALVALRARRRPRPPLPAPPRERFAGKHDHLTRPQRIAIYGHKHVTLRGDVVQSGPERRIADFLHRRGVRYVYEAMMPGATPDFWLPDSNIVIEHWGMDHPRYVERRWVKARMYRKRGFLLVETEKKDVPRLEQVLESRLLAADPRVFDRREPPT